MATSRFFASWFPLVAYYSVWQLEALGQFPGVMFSEIMLTRSNQPVPIGSKNDEFSLNPGTPLSGANIMGTPFGGVRRDHGIFGGLWGGGLSLDKPRIFQG